MLNIKAAKAIASLDDLGSARGKVEWLKLDLSDPKNAKEAAQEFLTKEKRLDILSSSTPTEIYFRCSFILNSSQ